MQPCEIPGLTEVDCDGHLGKFDDCLGEALYEWSLGGFADGNTGSGDFEGHTAIFIVERDEKVAIDPDGRNRAVMVPAGAYLMFESSTGFVTYMVADGPEQAWEIYHANDTRYALWDHGCDPDHLAGHEVCGEHDECQQPW